MITIRRNVTGVRIHKKEFKSVWRSDPKYLEAFNKVKAMIAHDTMLYFPDPNKPFLIVTDASDLGI